jgi:hypothetical protein
MSSADAKDMNHGFSPENTDDVIATIPKRGKAVSFLSP